MAKINFKPYADKILVKPILKDQQKSTGGLYMPAVATDKFLRGEVVAVGPGRRDYQSGQLHAPTVALGDVVVYAPQFALNLVIDGEIYGILKELDLFGVEGGQDKNSDKVRSNRKKDPREDDLPQIKSSPV